MSSTHLLSLDALLAIVQNFRAWQITSQDDNFAPESQYLNQAPAEVGIPREQHLALPQGSTQINSAGIIFSSSAANEKLSTEGLSLATIPSVRSESAIMARIGSIPSDEPTRTDECAHDLKAASGYMMAIRMMEDENTGESPAVQLPTPKELIEVRQKKKVHTLSHAKSQESH